MSCALPPFSLPGADILPPTLLRADMITFDAYFADFLPRLPLYAPFYAASACEVSAALSMRFSPQAEF